MRKFFIIVVFFSWMCVSVVNYDSAEIKEKTLNKRFAGYFEGGRRREEISTCYGTSVQEYTWGKFGGNAQMGYGISKNFELGGQFGGEFGKEKTQGEVSYFTGGLYLLPYFKIGGKIKNINFASKAAFGGGPYFIENSFGFLPLGYADFMLGFFAPEKLTIYGGINLFSYRFGVNLNFNNFSLLGQINFLEKNYNSIKIGAGYKF
jgi:hypothetical protein